MEQKRVRRSDLVADQICAMIQERYHVHDKLPVESELAQMFSVSRITVREAISKLSYLDIVDVRQGEGTFVNEVNLSNFTRSIKPFFTMKKQNIGDVFEFRILLETAAARLAAQRATPEEITQLEKTLEEMDNVLLKEDMESYNMLDTRYHYEIARAGHNELLLSIYRLLIDVVGNSIGISTTQSSLAISVITHKRICSAIREHDSEQAYTAMHTHIAGAAEFVAATMKKEQTIHEQHAAF